MNTTTQAVVAPATTQARQRLPRLFPPLQAAAALQATATRKRRTRSLLRQAADAKPLPLREAADAPAAF